MGHQNRCPVSYHHRIKHKVTIPRLQLRRLKGCPHNPSINLRVQPNPRTFSHVLQLPSRAPAATIPTQSMSRHLRGCHHNSLTAVTPKSETPMPKRHSADYATADYANINPRPKRQCRNAAVPITHKPITSSPPAKPTTKSETPNRN